MSSRCTYVMHNQEPCGEPLLEGDSTCRFHSKNLEAKKEGFNKAFFERLKQMQNDEGTEIFDFKGYIFPDSIIFKETRFNKDTFFNNCEFHGEQTVFRWVTFSGDITEFAGTHFKAQDTLFENSQFTSVKTDFSSTIFEGQKASFSHTQFKEGDVDFREAHFFVKEMDLSYARLEAKSMEFERMKFLTKGNESKVNTSVNIYAANIDNVSNLFESLQIPGRGSQFLRKRKNFFGDFRFHLSKMMAIRYPSIDRKTRSAWVLADYQSRHPYLYRLWYLTSKCGEGFFRWGVLTLFITFLFALGYSYFYHIDHTTFDIRHLNQSSPFWTFWYFSIATFTTLGSGDIVPMNDCLQVAVMVEVFLGYIMLGGLISIFANKLARRS